MKTPRASKTKVGQLLEGGVWRKERGKSQHSPRAILKNSMRSIRRAETHLQKEG